MRRGENIYWRRCDKRWEGRYAIGKKLNGKTKYRSVYGKTATEVKLKLYPLKAKYQLLQEEQGYSCITLEEWGFQWLNEKKQEVKESTYANYEHKLCHNVLREIGRYALNELDEYAAAALLDALVERNLKASTIRSIFRIAKQCVNDAIKRNMMKVNPFALIKLPNADKATDQALTKEEQKSLEETAAEEKMGRGLPVLLALHAGLRIGEIAALKWSDLDFKSNFINVKATLQRVFSVLDGKKTELIYSTAKTAASVRSIPMSDTLKRALVAHKAQSTGEFVFSTKENPSEPRLLTYHFHRIRKVAGLEHIHFHQLRHTFATRCIESGADIKTVSNLLGHSSAKMTLDIYTHSTRDQQILVVKHMEQAIS